MNGLNLTSLPPSPATRLKLRKKLVDGKIEIDYDFPLVSITKNKAPRGWSYPLQTNEIIKKLQLPNEEFHISYANSPPATVMKESFLIFTVVYAGKRLRHVIEKSISNGPYYQVTVHVCRPYFRKILNSIILKEIFPIILKWKEKNDKCPMYNVLNCKYTVLASERQCNIELVHNNNIIYKKEIDLMKEISESAA